ncbi:MAG TPA: hypothetical protein VN680_12085 [Burkholderiaceae bacterium]|jgi:hypothetical protein|nr:hypothetical protein [Burkholderiaceae bacterium]
MKPRLDFHPRWHTAWQGHDIVVFRNGLEVDRIHASDIRRVIFVQSGEFLTAGDLECAVVELDDQFVVFPADTGFAGRVHFERQSFWDSRACIYWVSGCSGSLPSDCMRRRGFTFLRRVPRYARIERTRLAPVVESWCLEGPQTWDERRWSRIKSQRPFTNSIAASINAPDTAH